MLKNTCEISLRRTWVIVVNANEHEKRIREEYDACLRGEGAQGVGGDSAMLIEHIKEAAKEGVRQEEIDGWLTDVQKKAGLL